MTSSTGRSLISSRCFRRGIGSSSGNGAQLPAFSTQMWICGLIHKRWTHVCGKQRLHDPDVLHVCETLQMLQSWALRTNASVRTWATTSLYNIRSYHIVWLRLISTSCRFVVATHHMYTIFSRRYYIHQCFPPCLLISYLPIDVHACY